MTFHTMFPAGLCDLIGQLVPVRAVYGGMTSKVEITRVGDWGLRVSTEHSHDWARMQTDDPPGPAREWGVLDLALREAGVGAVDIEVHRDGFVWRQRVEDSRPVAPMRRAERSDRCGVTWTFWPTVDWIAEAAAYDAALVGAV